VQDAIPIKQRSEKSLTDLSLRRAHTRAVQTTRATMSGSHLSKDFFELVKAIGESKSKQEEDRIILDEVQALKKRMPDATVGRKKVG
jgi:thymidine kinase